MHAPDRNPAVGRGARYALTVALLLVSAGCRPAGEDAAGPASEPAAVTAADSLALRVHRWFGAEAWARAPYLSFVFAVQRHGAERPVGHRHLWDKRTGRYRLEWPIGSDSTAVALFNVDSREGTVYVNGSPAATADQAALLDGAYRRFINDTYWLMMPVKLFDPGVVRAVDVDSSDARLDVLRLSFQDVGLTPGDRYWVAIDGDGRVVRWSYLLQGRDRPSTRFWTGYREISTPAGLVRVAERKDSATSTLYSDGVTFPEAVEDRRFTDPTPTG